MKKYTKEFIRRGMMFAWGGPVVLAIVWLCLRRGGVITSLTVAEAAQGTLSVTLLAFIAAGITVVNQIEQLPAAIAALIHLGVLYAAYLSVYLINGWIVPSAVAVFTVVFVALFALTWGVVVLAVSRSVAGMNRSLGVK